MNETIPQAESWTKLGSRTFWLFLMRRSEVPLGFLLLAVAVTAVRSASFVPKAAVPLAGLAGVVCFAIFFVSALVALLLAWVEYRSHEYCLSDDAFRVKQGMVTKQELAIPYRQIQNVDIERSVSDQILGLSKVVILTAGHEDEQGNESEGILPAMDRRLASALQEELLRRAEVEKVVQVNP